MTRKALYPLVAAAIVVASATMSCDGPTEPPLEPADPDELLTASVDDGDDGTSEEPAPLPCPGSETYTDTEIIGSLGGTVSAGGSSITLPMGAVLSPTEITLTVPPAEYMEIDIKANDQDHFTFALPVTVVIGYGRCTDPAFEEEPLVAWHWDSLLGILLEPFPSVDDKTARTVTFETGHLSGFLIAN